MLLRLDPASDDPLHVRIAAAVRRAIADGEVSAGDKLPPARELAAALDVNVNTVLRGYRDLRDEGLIELRRGRGATVREATVDRARLTSIADELVREAARLGVSTEELIQLVEERS